MAGLDSQEPFRTAAWTEAVAQVHEWILGYDGARELTLAEVGAYPIRGAVRGWRIPVQMNDARRQFDLLVDRSFPWRPTQVALVNAPPFPSLPHVEKDGILCVIPEGAEVSVADPLAVAKRVLSDGVSLVEDDIAGATTDDFRDEFRSYWVGSPGEPIVRSLLDPTEGTRAIHLWRGKDVYLIADEPEAIGRWINNFIGAAKPSEYRPVPAVLLALDRPPTPSEYPTTGQQVLALARAAGGEELLRGLIATQPDKVVVVLKVQTDADVCFAGVSIYPPPKPIKGFRPGRVPEAIASARYLAGSIRRIEVERVDAEWVHCRAASPDLECLRGSAVVFFGCGSLGSSVALRLAEAGVGSLVLVDPDLFHAANVGRHALGLGDVGRWKAEALARRIRRDYPHLSVEWRRASLDEVIETSPELVAGSSLVVSTIGSWAAEGALNAIHVEGGRAIPIVYGWTEPHAVAGHAVVVSEGSGCLACGMTDTGVPFAPVATWPNGPGQRREPACGAVYQPYGPIELAHTVDLVAETAMDVITGQLGGMSHRVWVGPDRYLTRAGGVWNPEWLAAAGGDTRGGRQCEIQWDTRADCPVCGKVK